MKAITLRQPWASLFVAGAKLIETRSWSTPYRGPLAVHASAKMNIDERHLCYSPPFASALAHLRFNTPADLPVGAVLGIVEIVDCLRMVGGSVLLPGAAIGLTTDPRLTPNERAFGHYAAGRFAWITPPARTVFTKPIPARGMLGLWELPGDVAEQIL